LKTEIAFIEDAIFFDRPLPLAPCTVRTSSDFIVAIASGLVAPKLIRINFIPVSLAYIAAGLIGSIASINLLSERAVMIAIDVDSVTAEFSQKREIIADCGAHGPMSQQDAVGSTGHEMHPQKFVQLVGSKCRKA
jgi:hypothetical protein